MPGFMFRVIQLFIFIFILTSTSYSQIDPGARGQYPQGWFNQTISREGRNMNCRIYYPSFSDGENSQIDTVNGPWPIVAFGHGFFMQTSYYLSLFRQLASHGFIVIAPQFTDTQHGELGKDLIFCLNFIKSSSTVPGNRFYKLADTSKTGVSGHSMGGGASLLSTIYDSTITISAPFAAAETVPSIISTINSTKSIIYLISSQNDGITPPATTQIPMYENTPDNKALLTIKGGNHTKFMDTNIWDWTDAGGYINRNLQIYLSQKYLTAVLKLFLHEDKSYWNYALGDSANADTSVVLRKSVNRLPLKSFKLLTEEGSVTNQNINIRWEKSSTLNPLENIRYNVEFALDSLFESLFYVSPGTTDSSISIDSIPPGEFYVRIVASTPGGIQKFSNNSIKLILTPPLSVKEDSQGFGTFRISKVFPNPFNPAFSITIDNQNTTDILFELYDISGKKILSSEKVIYPGISKEYFDLSGNPSGIYFLSVRVEGRSFVKKVMLQK